MRTRPASTPAAVRPERAPTRRRTWMVVGVIGLTLSVVAGWYYLLGPGADLRAAEAALDRNDPAAARPHLDRRLKYWPSDQRTLFLAARAARRTGAFADAERFLTRYEAEHGSTEEARFEWALLGAHQGDFTGDAGRLLDNLAPKDPQANLVLEAVANGFRAEYRFPDAIGILDRLLERDPNHVPALILRGELYAERLNMPGAERDLRKAVEVAPESPAAHAALAGLLTHTGHSREAVAHYDWVLTAMSGDPSALLGAGRALADAADMTGAVARLDELITRHPGDANGLTERARLALRQNRPAEAVPLLERATTAAPWNRAATRMLWQAQTELNQTDVAAHTAKRLAEQAAEDAEDGRLKVRVKTTPADNAARWDLWRLCQKTGREAEGYAWLLEILRFDPKYGQAHAALAEYYDRAGQPRRAAAHRTAAVQP